MLALAGITGTVGFVGKFQLIHALVDGGYTWLAIVLVVGSMISLGYYLRVVAAVWMRPEIPSPGVGFASRFAFGTGTGAGSLAPIAGGSAEADLGSGSLPPIAGGSPEADAPGAGGLPPIAGGSPEADGPGAGAGAVPCHRSSREATLAGRAPDVARDASSQVPGGDARRGRVLGRNGDRLRRVPAADVHASVRARRARARPAISPVALRARGTAASWYGYAGQVAEVHEPPLWRR